MSILISEKMYVGFQVRTEHGETSKLGFATYLPIDDSKKQQEAFDKRKQTVDSWASGWRSKKDPQTAEIFNNESLYGFKIAREVKRHGWGSGNVVWRIEDPRGFELEIQSANMASILACTTMVNGVIEGKCKWGWNTTGGSRIVLLPESSEPYQEAVKATMLYQQKDIPISQVSIGDTVELKNGITGIYCGSLHYIEPQYLNDHSGQHRYSRKWKASTKRLRFFIIQTPNAVTVYSMASPKVARVLHERPISAEDGARLVNDVLLSTHQSESATGTKYFVAVSTNTITEQDFRAVLVPTNKNPAKRSNRDQSITLVTLGDTLYEITADWHGEKNKYDIVEINKDRLLSKSIFSSKLSTNTYGMPGTMSRYSTDHFKEVTLTDAQVRDLKKFTLQVQFGGEYYPPNIW